MKILYLIPARGGSKGITRKNIKPLQGKPLICYSIDVAKKMTSDKDICISSDDDEIIRVVEDYGLKVDFKRPAELATDHSGTEDTIRHALKFYADKGIDYNVVVLLQATSPLRNHRHVKESLDLFSNEIDMVASVKYTSSNPYFVLFEENEEGYLEKSKSGKYIRRQDCPIVYQQNGAVYVINVKSLEQKRMTEFKKVTKYLMNDIVSLDLDEKLDWFIIEQILKNNFIDE